jgi:hypothetical protein
MAIVRNLFRPLVPLFALPRRRAGQAGILCCKKTFKFMRQMK